MAITDRTTEEFERLSIDETLAGLETDRQKGLDSTEADGRRSRYGFNEIPEQTESLAHRIVRRFWGPIPWMIEAAALLSALVGKWEDFTIIMVLLVTNVGIDFWQESKALIAVSGATDAARAAADLVLLTPGLSVIVDAIRGPGSPSSG